MSAPDAKVIVAFTVGGVKLEVLSLRGVERGIERPAELAFVVDGSPVEATEFQTMLQAIMLATQLSAGSRRIH